MRIIALAFVLLITTDTRADCPVGGRGGDEILSAMKNRTDVPRKTTSRTIGELIKRRDIVPHINRKRWREVKIANEGTGVVIVGSFLGVKREGPESANCGSVDDRDYHLWLADFVNDAKSASMVVEITPRLRKMTWTINALRRLVRRGDRVRITGWLLYDQEHEIDQSRGTLWEIHPVTKIEIYVGHEWVEL